MLGAIAGDIIGSPWEGSSCRNLKADLFGFGCQITDDTVCTVGIADALLRNTDLATTLRAWVSRYPNRGYGGMFHTWAHSAKGPYNSFSNGGAMRVSSTALLAASEEEVLRIAKQTADITHNHQEGVRGAQAIALAIWLARQGNSTIQIRHAITRKFGYNLSRSVEDCAIGGFSTLAEETVPEALIAALSAESFEEAMRNALYIGGDSDTLACMAGGIAEALFGMPEDYIKSVRLELPSEMLDVVDALYARVGESGPKLAVAVQNPKPVCVSKFEKFKKFFQLT